LFDCEFLCERAFARYVDFYVREHSLGTFELRWNIIVARNWKLGDYLGTQVVRQRPWRPPLRFLVPKETTHLSVQEHLSIFFEAAKTAQSKWHWFKGVSVTLTHPRSAWMWRDSEKPDPFPVIGGLSYFSLEAFLDAVVSLHGKFGNLIGGIDFVVRYCPSVMRLFRRENGRDLKRMDAR
jgi:hypothetical protein